MRTVRISLAALLLAVLLAACSIPLPPQEADLGLQLDRHPILVTGIAAATDITPAQDSAAFAGSVSVSASKVDDRLTITKLVLPIELLQPVRLISPPGGLTEDTVILRDFVISFSVSSGADFVQIGQISLPPQVEMRLLAGSADYRLQLPEGNLFELEVPSTALDGLNDIVTGPSDEEFAFTARIDFMADLPADTELEFTLREGTARIEGRGSL